MKKLGRLLVSTRDSGTVVIREDKDDFVDFLSTYESYSFEDETSVPEPTPTFFLRSALSSQDQVIHSGHSLTDAYAGQQLQQLFTSVFPGTVWEQQVRATIPGSSTRYRWDNAAQNNPNPRDHMANFDALMITERGLSDVGVAPITHEQFLEDILYELKFAERAAALNRDITLWGIWPSYQMPNWQDALEDYENRFQVRRQYLEWKLKQLYPAWGGHVWLCPGHLLMQHLLTDLPPGVSTYQSMFQDDIHPGPLLEHGLAVFVMTYLYGLDMRSLTTSYLPSGVTAEQDQFFKNVAWSILSDYSAAGMGGREYGRQVWDGHDWFPDLKFPSQLSSMTHESGSHWEPPPAQSKEPETVSGFVTRISRIDAEGVALPQTNLATPMPTGNVYGIMAVTPDDVQPGNTALALTLRNGTVNVASINVRSDLGYLMLENDASGGIHVASIAQPRSGKLIVEFWIDESGGGMTVNGKEFSASMTPSTMAANSFRVGQGSWGPEPFAGILHQVALFSAKPSDEDRAALRSWAEKFLDPA